MCFDVDIETAKSVSAKRVSTTLQDDSCRPIVVYARPYDVFEKFDILRIFNAIMEGDVERMVGARTSIVEGTCVV